MSQLIVIFTRRCLSEESRFVANEHDESFSAFKTYDPLMRFRHSSFVIFIGKSLIQTDLESSLKILVLRVFITRAEKSQFSRDQDTLGLF